MAVLHVQLLRGGTWNGLTTIRIASSGPADEKVGRDRAHVEANRQLVGWQGHFVGHRLRIVEVA